MYFKMFNEVLCATIATYGCVGNLCTTNGQWIPYLFVKRWFNFCVVQWSMHGCNFGTCRTHSKHNMFISACDWNCIARPRAGGQCH